MKFPRLTFAKMPRRRIQTVLCRGAFTLVEMMAYLSISATVVSLAIRMVHQAMTLSTTARNASAIQTACDRMATEFRADVQGGTSASVQFAAAADVNAASVLTIKTPHSEAIEWIVQGPRIRREIKLPAEGARHEQFLLPDGLHAHFALLEDGARVALTVVQDGEFTGAAPRALRRIEAGVGRALRLSQPVRAQKSP